MFYERPITPIKTILHAVIIVQYRGFIICYKGLPKLLPGQFGCSLYCPKNGK